MVSTQELQTWKWPIALVTLGFMTLSVSNTAYSQNNSEKKDATVAPQSMPSTQSGTGENEGDSKKAVTFVSPASIPNSTSVSQSNGWIYQMRANFGLANTSAAKDFKSDRLGAALFAGKVLADLELPIPFVSSKDVSVGASYHTFSGVESVKDSSWALQSIGAQMRVILEPGLPNNIDLAVQGGVAWQRLVSEEMQTRHEKVKNGVALTAGGYARWPVLKELQLIGGTDLVLGQASCLAISLGLEAGF
jgi:hypothetical protein